MVLVQEWPFFEFFFKLIQARKICFTIFQTEITPFQAIKTRASKSQKIDIFSKGLTHGFSLKMGIFPTFFFLANEGQENVFYDILERKNAFLGYKKKEVEKVEKFAFFKGVNPWFWSKNGHFFKLLFFRHYRPVNCLLRYSRT